MIREVECPGCLSKLSWRKLYSNNLETAKDVEFKPHITRCDFCGCNFEYQEVLIRSKAWLLLKKVSHVKILKIREPGKYARTE